MLRAVAALAFAGLTLGAAAANAVVVVRTAVNYHPVARATVTTAAVVGTAAIVGSVVRTLPPSCRTVVSGGLAYQQCGNAWYQPQYSGSQVTYVVVSPPR